jgi:phosphoserine phosphatase
VQSKTNEYLKDLPSTILQTSADQVAAIKAQTDELVTSLKDVGSKIDRLRAAGVE